MKNVILFTVLLLSTFIAKADYISPSEYVIAAIRSAQNDDVEKLRRLVDIEKISSSKDQSFSEKDLIKLFKSISIDAIEFEKQLADETVKIINPMNIQFEIESIVRENLHPRTIYKIVGVQL